MIFSLMILKKHSNVQYLYFVKNVLESSNYSNKTIKNLFEKFEPYREMYLEKFLGKYAEQSYIYVTKMFTPDDMVYYKKRYDEHKMAKEISELVRQDIEELKRKGEWIDRTY